MSGNDAHLYGVQRPKKLSGKEISSSSTLAFTSELSSLITSSRSSKGNSGGGGAASSARRGPSFGRTRPKKDDIFTKHNRNARKRALADTAPDSQSLHQRHSTTSEDVDDATWKRARRKMEEKARLYAAMKRGDVEDEAERYAVDFDRKWAEAQEGQGDRSSDGEDDDDGGSGSDSGGEIVEYEDEFGRMRRGTQADAEREARRRAARERGIEDTDRFTARPRAPDSIIMGDTIQAEAFNPDAQREQAMADLAAKRDRSLTPPPETHFDARQEVRQKGQGFFQFSADEEERRRQMAGLEREREETEKRRRENAERREARRKEVEERRKVLQARRGKAQADRFLDGLTAELGGSATREQPEELRTERDDIRATGGEADAGSVLRARIEKLDEDTEA